MISSFSWIFMAADDHGSCKLGCHVVFSDRRLDHFSTWLIIMKGLLLRSWLILQPWGDKLRFSMINPAFSLISFKNLMIRPEIAPFETNPSNNDWMKSGPQAGLLEPPKSCNIHGKRFSGVKYYTSHTFRFIFIRWHFPRKNKGVLAFSPI